MILVDVILTPKLVNQTEVRKVRVVAVPDNQWSQYTIQNLETVYRFGQNESQPMESMRSVSPGDIIVMPDGSEWMVKSFGFQQMKRSNGDNRRYSNCCGSLPLGELYITTENDIVTATGRCSRCKEGAVFFTTIEFDAQSNDDENSDELNKSNSLEEFANIIKNVANKRK